MVWRWVLALPVLSMKLAWVSTAPSMHTRCQEVISPGGRGGGRRDCGRGIIGGMGMRYGGTIDGGLQLEIFRTPLKSMQLLNLQPQAAEPVFH